jgi:hypothetical protein
MSDSYVAPTNAVSRAGAGVVGGLAGAVVLGVILQVFGLLAPFAGLVGSRSVSVAWTVLLAIGGFAGGLYGVLLGRWVSGQLVSAVGVGLVYGAAWWVLLPLLVLPLRAGGPLLAVGDTGIRVLVAYAVFGVLIRLVYALAGPRRRYWRGPRRRDYGLVYALPRRRRRRARDD